MGSPITLPMHVRIRLCITKNMLIYSKIFQFQLRFDGSIVFLYVAFVCLTESLMKTRFIGYKAHLFIV